MKYIFLNSFDISSVFGSSMHFFSNCINLQNFFQYFIEKSLKKKKKEQNPHISGLSTVQAHQAHDF